MTRPYYSLSEYLKERYGRRVFRVAINTGLTCPNRDGTKGRGGCAYCDPEMLAPTGLAPAMPVREQLERGMERVRKRYGAQGFIAYFQTNTNTYAPLGFLEKAFGEALEHPGVVALAVSTRPDCLDDRVLDLLQGLRKEKDLWLEMGLQSSNDETLRRVNRGHTASDFKDAARWASERGIETCAHVILGLPGEGRGHALETARFLAGVDIWGVKFHQLDIVRGTPLEEEFRDGGLKALTLDEYSSLVVECLEELPPHTVIHRLSGETPVRLLAAPQWGVDKFAVIERIRGLMAEKKTLQGARFERGAGTPRGKDHDD